MDNPKQKELADLLMRTGHEHHQAFIETDGADPEWPIWYAGYLQAPISEILGTPITKSHIIYELVWLDENVDPGDEHWTQVYARELLSKHS